MDSAAIFETSEQEINKNVEIWNKALLKGTLKTNEEKSRVMEVEKINHNICIVSVGKSLE